MKKFMIRAIILSLFCLLNITEFMVSMIMHLTLWVSFSAKKQNQKNCFKPTLQPCKHQKKKKAYETKKVFVPLGINFSFTTD